MHQDNLKILCLQFLGITLGGAKSARTTVVGLKYYPDKKRIFIDSIQQKMQGSREFHSNELLVQFIKETGVSKIAVNAPTSLPPCIGCVIDPCPGMFECTVPEVEYMRFLAEEARFPKEKFPTPYTQRASDLYLRTKVVPYLSEKIDVEETLGGGHAPLAARFQYLQGRLPEHSFLEVNAKIALGRMQDWFGITDRELRRYRSMDEGMINRVFILQRLEQFQDSQGIVPDLFLYDTDMQTVASNLHAFDALIGALLCVYDYEGLLEEFPDEYADDFEKVAVPKKWQQLLEEKRK